MGKVCNLIPPADRPLRHYLSLQQCGLEDIKHMPRLAPLFMVVSIFYIGARSLLDVLDWCNVVIIRSICCFAYYFIKIMITY